jgi:hypothetical protein
MTKGNPFVNAFIVSNVKIKKKDKNKKNSFKLPTKYKSKPKKTSYDLLNNERTIIKQHDTPPPVGKKVISKKAKQLKKKKIKRIDELTSKRKQPVPFGFSKKQKQIKFDTEYFPGVLEVDALIKKPKKHPQIHELLPQLSFMITYIAPRNSGKTNNLVTFLTDPEFCYKKFDFIYIWSSTFRIDPTWKVFRRYYDEDEDYRVYKTFNKEEIASIFTTIEEEYVERENQGKKQKYYLFLFDDMGDQNICSNYNIGPIETVAVKGRHYNVSGIILVQKRTMLSRNVRTNTTNCIVFDLTDNREMTVCSEESRGELSHDEFMHIYKYCTHEKHNFLHINYQAPKNIRYRKNWNELIHTNLGSDVEKPKITN